MKQIIDIHSHMLPAVDDGCPTKKEALRMLKMYEKQNVEAVICTPHYGPCAITGASVDDAYTWIKSTGSPVNLYLGNEILAGRNTIDDIRSGDARTLAGSDYSLIEFEQWSYYTPAKEILADCIIFACIGLNVIIAHPERYTTLQLQPEYYKKLVDTGAKLQINAYDVYENTDRSVTRATQYLLRKKLVSFIGSDAHGAERRSPRLSTGVQWIYDHCDEKYADAIVHDNAAEIIKKGEA